MPLDNLGQFYEVRHHEPWTSINSNNYRCYLLQFPDGEKVWSNGRDIQIHWPASGSHLAVHTLAVTQVANMEAINIQTSFVYSSEQQHGEYRSKMDDIGMSLIVRVGSDNNVVTVEWDLDTPAETTPNESPTKDRAKHGWAQDPSNDQIEAFDGAGDECPSTPHTYVEKRDETTDSADMDDASIPKLKRFGGPEEAQPEPSESGTTYVSFEELSPCIHVGLNVLPASGYQCSECKDERIATSKETQDGHEDSKETSDRRKHTGAERTTEDSPAKETASEPTTQMGLGVPRLPKKASVSSSGSSSADQSSFGFDGCLNQEIKARNDIKREEGTIPSAQGGISNFFPVHAGPPSLPTALTEPHLTTIQQATPESESKSMCSCQCLEDAAETNVGCLKNGLEMQRPKFPVTCGSSPQNHRISAEQVDTLKSFLEDMQKDMSRCELRNGPTTPADLPALINGADQQRPAEYASQLMDYMVPKLSAANSMDSEDNESMEADFTEEELRAQRQREEDYYDNLLLDQLEYSYYDLDEDKFYVPPVYAKLPPKEPEPETPKTKLEPKPQPPANKKQSTILFFLEELQHHRKMMSEEGKIVPIPDKKDPSRF